MRKLGGAAGRERGQRWWSNRALIAGLAALTALLVKPVDVAAQQRLSGVEIAQIQDDLRRVGCYTGANSGKWTGAPVKALRRALQKYLALNPNTPLTTFTNPATLRGVLRSLTPGYCDDWQLTKQYVPIIGYSTRDLSASTIDEIKFIQTELTRMGCYFYKIDGKWQELSQQAADFAMSEYALDRPEFDMSTLTNPQVLRAVLRTLPDNYCGDPEAKPTSAPRVCTKDNIARDYLASRPPQFSSAVELQRTLDLVAENFNTVFTDPTADFLSGLESDARDKVKKYGKEGVTFDKTKEALKRASSLLAKLTFNHGLKSKPDCRSCYAYNDWIFLKNISQATGGHLVGKPIKGDEVFRRYPVDWVTEPMIIGARDSIKVYRSISAAVNDQLEYIVELTRALGDPLLKKRAEDKLKEAETRLEEMVTARDVEMSQLVGGFVSATGNNPEKAIGRLFRLGQMSSQCQGFDGSSVDQ